LSYAPALLMLPLPKDAAAASPAAEKTGLEKPSEDAEKAAGDKQPAENESGSANRTEKNTAKNRSEKDPNKCARLLFFFILMVQLSEALQYAWAQIPSKHVIVPTINPTKTWEGLLGGTASVTLIGAALGWAIPPFPYWFAGGMSAVIALMGFAGSLTMSAIKRDRGVKDYGTLVAGHSGVLDRIDSICFSAPVFYHFTQYYLSYLASTGQIRPVL
jgi:phosphatidate cytidylyltransferase